MELLGQQLTLNTARYALGLDLELQTAAIAFGGMSGPP
jgi:hypothetical protein